MMLNENVIGGAQGIREAIVRGYAVENIDRFAPRRGMLGGRLLVRILLAAVR
jgi:hypothetical protein